MIFVDTSFWLGQAMRRDGRHEEAVALTRLHASSRLVTSNLVQGETWTLLRYRAGHRIAMDWRAQVAEITERIHRIDAPLETDAWTWLAARDERAYSFVDATSFALMRKLRIREALAFDGDFAAAGFVELRP
jgi:uncharacterized protein